MSHKPRCLGRAAINQMTYWSLETQELCQKNDSEEKIFNDAQWHNQNTCKCVLLKRKLISQDHLNPINIFQFTSFTTWVNDLTFSCHLEFSSATSMQAPCLQSFDFQKKMHYVAQEDAWNCCQNGTRNIKQSTMCCKCACYLCCQYNACIKCALQTIPASVIVFYFI